LSEELFEELSTRCRLGLLSNTDPIHAAHLERHFSFVRYFPVRIYSNVVGTSKPSPAIYHAALRALEVAPSEALYIDDIEEFAEAARQLGMDAMRFESATQLDEELARRGLMKTDPSVRSLRGLG
jgi:HAD superfamily hydrolase (TIGR01509 family)